MTDGANNVRITNRMIYDRQETLIKSVHVIDKQVGKNETKIVTMSDDIDALKKKSNLVDGLIAGIAVIGSIFGITTK